MPSKDPSRFLRYAFRADAVFCALAGTDLMLFSSRLAEMLGIRSSGLLILLGAGLVAWAVHLVIASMRETPSIGEAWYFVAGGFLWIVGSAALILSGTLSTEGNWLVGIVAVAVLGFTEAQFYGLRRLRRAPRVATELRHAA